MSIARTAQARIELSGQAFNGDQPLVAVMRGEHVGSLHRGTFAVVNAGGELRASLGDPAQPVYLRSAAKPFQVMPAILAGAIDRFNITQRELAVLCASHNGEPRHLEAVLSVLAKIGLEESALQCGVHPPLYEPAARERWRQGLEPTPACNNCSGAHAGMLLACRARNWPIEGYGLPDHPLQRETRAILATFAGLATAEIEYAIDNCHVPAFRLPIQSAARAFACLSDGTSVDQAVGQAANIVVEAMTAYPEMVGGIDRFDSELMTVAGRALVSKGGAEGFQGIGLIGRAIGIALKVSDGNARAVAPAIVQILKALDVLDDAQVTRLSNWWHPTTHDLRGAAVGYLTSVFVLDAEC